MTPSANPRRIAPMSGSALPGSGTGHDHVAFGLRVRSCLPLPELLPGVATDSPDLEIVYGEVPANLDGVLKRGVRYQAARDRLLLIVDGIARFLIECGRRVTIARATAAADDDVRVFLLGPALSAALHQRGDLVLHGSAIEWDGAAVGFLGLSGAGKSTLATAFGRRGRRLLTDDLCVVRPDGDGGLKVFPGFPLTKLWLDSLRELQISAEPLPRVRSKLEKRVLRLDAFFSAQPLPLRKLYLSWPVNDESLALRELKGPRKFDVLKRQTYRFGFLGAGEGMAGHFQHAVRLAQETPVAMLLRSNVRFRLPELLDLIAADLRA